MVVGNFVGYGVSHKIVLACVGYGVSRVMKKSVCFLGGGNLERSVDIIVRRKSGEAYMVRRTRLLLPPLNQTMNMT